MKAKLSDEKIKAACKALAAGETTEIWGRDRDLTLAIEGREGTWRYWAPTVDGFEFAIPFGRWPQMCACEAFVQAILLRRAFTERIGFVSAEEADATLHDVFGRMTMLMELRILRGYGLRLAEAPGREASTMLRRITSSPPISLIFQEGDLVRLPRRGARRHWTQDIREGRPERVAALAAALHPDCEFPEGLTAVRRGWRDTW